MNFPSLNFFLLKHCYCERHFQSGYKLLKISQILSEDGHFIKNTNLWSVEHSVEEEFLEILIICKFLIILLL